MVLNFTPVIREQYRIGVPEAGDYTVLFNSDSSYYSGSNAGSCGTIAADDTPWMGRSASLTLTLPPLAALVLKRN